MHNTAKSRIAFTEAIKVITGGVNSPVRSFKGVGGSPIFFASGNGASVKDIDGNTYLDYVGSWGPLILGHVHPEVVKAIKDTAEKEPVSALRRCLNPSWRGLSLRWFRRSSLYVL